MNLISNYIDGKITSSSSNDVMKVFDPSTGEHKSNVSLSNEDDFKKVINSSKKSFLEWSKFTPLKRSRIL